MDGWTIMTVSPCIKFFSLNGFTLYFAVLTVSAHTNESLKASEYHLWSIISCQPVHILAQCILFRHVKYLWHLQRSSRPSLMHNWSFSICLMPRSILVFRWDIKGYFKISTSENGLNVQNFKGFIFRSFSVLFPPSTCSVTQHIHAENALW